MKRLLLSVLVLLFAVPAAADEKKEPPKEPTVYELTFVTRRFGKPDACTHVLYTDPDITEKLVDAARDTGGQRLEGGSCSDNFPAYKVLGRCFYSESKELKISETYYWQPTLTEHKNDCLTSKGARWVGP